MKRASEKTGGARPTRGVKRQPTIGQQAADVMLPDGPEAIERGRKEAGSTLEGRDYVRLWLSVPESESLVDTAGVYVRNVIMPAGGTEALVLEIDKLCSRFDPGGVLGAPDWPGERPIVGRRG